MHTAAIVSNNVRTHKRRAMTLSARRILDAPKFGNRLESKVWNPNGFCFRRSFRSFKKNQDVCAFDSQVPILGFTPKHFELRRFLMKPFSILKHFWHSNFDGLTQFEIQTFDPKFQIQFSNSEPLKSLGHKTFAFPYMLIKRFFRK